MERSGDVYTSPQLAGWVRAGGWRLEEEEAGLRGLAAVRSSMRSIGSNGVGGEGEGEGSQRPGKANPMIAKAAEVSCSPREDVGGS